LRALAEASETTAGGAGEWKSATCQGCTSWCSKQCRRRKGGKSPGKSEFEGQWKSGLS
jgi:hypothetical protein